MKKRIFYCIWLLLVQVSWSLNSSAQTPPESPGLWFSFDGTNEPYDHATIGSSAVKIFNGVPVSRRTDRFGNTQRAISFWGNQQRTSTLVTTDLNLDPSQVNLFGYSNSGTPLPDNFTLSCWVYVDATDTELARKICYTDYAESRFALIHKGPDIFLRRIAFNQTANAWKHFDYYYGAPASFDGGTGWYQVILVMGKRSEDGAAYTKLYIGKPNKVKYDATGPRVVTTPNDLLAMNFGGAYAFTGVQHFMHSGVPAWGMGNAYPTDPVHGEQIAPVQGIDDFVIWGRTLDELEARSLFNCQQSNPADQCWTTSEPNRAAPQPVTAALLDSLLNNDLEQIRVFPNPTKGSLHIDITGHNRSNAIAYSLYDLHGRKLFSKDIASLKSGQGIQIDNIKMYTGGTGIYLLEIRIGEQRKLFRIVVL